MQEIFLIFLKIDMECKNEFLNQDVKNKKEYAILFIDKGDFGKDRINNFNKKLKEFIELQKDKEKIDLSFICFHENINFIEENNEVFKILKDAKLIKSETIQLNKEDKQQTTFINDIDIRSSIFFKEAIFRECKFDSEVILEGAEFKDIANFRNAEFNKEFSFDSASFSDITYFEKANFKQNINFESAHFYKFAYFEEAIFEQDVIFKDTYVEEMINFHNVKFEKIDLENSNFRNVNFLGICGFKNKILTEKNFKNKDSTRIIKAHFEQENNITEANKYFVIEQEKYLDDLNEKDSTEPNRHINKISLLFNKYVSNYGTDWVRVLIVMFGFGFLTSFVYSLFTNPVDIANIQDYIIFFNENEQWLLWLEFSFAYILYILYHDKLWLFFYVFIISYMVTFYSSDILQVLSNKVITLVNPFNIFNQDIVILHNSTIHKNINYFEQIALYGIIIKSITITLIYQFIISFRNSSRRK